MYTILQEKPADFPDLSPAYRKCNSQFTDTADYRRPGRNTWQDESGVYANTHYKRQVMQPTNPIPPTLSWGPGRAAPSRVYTTVNKQSVADITSINTTHVYVTFLLYRWLMDEMKKIKIDWMNSVWLYVIKLWSGKKVGDFTWPKYFFIYLKIHNIL